MMQRQLLEISRRSDAETMPGGDLDAVLIERHDDARPVLLYTDFEDEYGGIEFDALLRSARYQERMRSHICTLMRRLDRMVELKDELLEHRRNLANLADGGASGKDLRTVLEKMEIPRVKWELHDEEWAWTQTLAWMRRGWVHE